jgi:hypothetical protein
MGYPMGDEPLHVHGDSVRVGIRLASIRFTNKLPAEDQVRMIQDTRPANMIVTEFPIAVITNIVRERQAQRRRTAEQTMLVILSRMSNEFTSLTLEEIDRISAKAWQMAAAMETQEGVSATLDSMDPQKKT